MDGAAMLPPSRLRARFDTATDDGFASGVDYCDAFYGERTRDTLASVTRERAAAAAADVLASVPRVESLNAQQILLQLASSLYSTLLPAAPTYLYFMLF